jgi:hypothetical protein
MLLKIFGYLLEHVVEIWEFIYFEIKKLVN